MISKAAPSPTSGGTTAMPPATKNAWGDSRNSSGTGLLSRIMAEQKTQQQRQHRNSNTAVALDEDEAMRLAMAASLQDSQAPNDDDDAKKPAAAAGNAVNEDVMDDDMRLALALSMSEAVVTDAPSPVAAVVDGDDAAVATAASAKSSTDDGLSASEAQQILVALQEADDVLEAKSLKLALDLENEQHEHQKRTSSCQQHNGNVKLLNRHDYLTQKSDSSHTPFKVTRKLLSGHDDFDDLEESEDDEHQDDVDDNNEEDRGFRLNDNRHTNSSSAWTRSNKDRGLVVGPLGEIRSKHDVALKAASNAQRLLFTDDARVSDKAYNDFRAKSKRHVHKGVAAHGHGRAENMDDHKTKGGVLDGPVRMLLQKVVNSGSGSTAGDPLLHKLNGAVKEGKEAVVYHGDGGRSPHGVAVKIFKRIQEFRQRAEYVDGDPRYHKTKFGREDKRHQVELWAEKEYRNLVRSNRAGVPTPTPLLHKRNVLFMTFLGDDGWPSPQLRELNMKHGSTNWTTFYCQTVVAVRRLYRAARLVHGDLSEYNLLVCPSSQLSDKDGDDLRIVLIDFGQAVDLAHPRSKELLRRDVDRVRAFFGTKGVAVLDTDATVEFVVGSTSESAEEYAWELTETEEEETTVVVESAEEGNAAVLAEVEDTVEEGFVMVDRHQRQERDGSQHDASKDEQSQSEHSVASERCGDSDGSSTGEDEISTMEKEEAVPVDVWDEENDLIMLRELMLQSTSLVKCDVQVDAV